MRHSLEAVVQIDDIPEPYRSVFFNRLGCKFGKVRSFLKTSTYLTAEVQTAIAYVWAFLPDETRRFYVHNRSPLGP